AWQFAKMQHVAQQNGWTRFVSMQNPLARGFLAGNRARDAREEKAAGATSRAQTDDIAQKYYNQDGDHAVAAALSKTAHSKGISSATLAYAWLLNQPGVSAPIVGASKPWQIEQAAQALDVSLCAEELAALAEPYRPHPVLGHQ
ncbi:MAG TPA: aldo/keto reductase, partial [Burkholderiaceae bacterium]|nr:aldo/keto reductase [Burkholderiaceae bacterium]